MGKKVLRAHGDSSGPDQPTPLQSDQALCSLLTESLDKNTGTEWPKQSVDQDQMIYTVYHLSSSF